MVLDKFEKIMIVIISLTIITLVFVDFANEQCVRTCNDFPVIQVTYYYDSNTTSTPVRHSTTAIVYNSTEAGLDAQKEDN